MRISLHIRKNTINSFQLSSTLDNPFFTQEHETKAVNNSKKERMEKERKKKLNAKNSRK